MKGENLNLKIIQCFVHFKYITFNLLIAILLFPSLSYAHSLPVYAFFFPAPLVILVSIPILIKFKGETLLAISIIMFLPILGIPIVSILVSILNISQINLYWIQVLVVTLLCTGIIFSLVGLSKLLLLQIKLKHNKADEPDGK